jgi:hypothetical protein
MQSAGIAGLTVQDMANWLGSKDVLLRYSSGRVAFFHQSVTEFLAATELARLYATSAKLLHDKLTYTRWDQALFLTLSLLPKEQANAFLDTVIETDFTLALNAVKYLETGCEEVVTRLLKEIPERAELYGNMDRRISHAVEYGVEVSLPISSCHEQSLREILKLGGTIAAAAASRLIELHREQVKDELIDSIFTRITDDYNYCTNVARAVRPFITESDVPDLVERAEHSLHKSLTNGNNLKRDIVNATLEELLADIDISTLRSVFLDPAKRIETQHTRMTLLSNMLRNHRGSESLVLLADLLLAGEILAAFPICLMKYGKSVDELPWGYFQAAHTQQLLTGIHDLDNARWSLDALQYICSMRPDLSAGIRHQVDQFQGLTRGCIIHAIDPADTAPLFDALANLCSMPPEQRRKEPLHLLDGIKLDWHCHETLFVDLLRLRDVSLARALLEGIYNREETIGTIEIVPIEWWLDWLADDSNPKAQWWLADRLCAIFADHLSVEAREAFVAEFNRAGSHYRPVLTRFVLWRWRDLTSDDLSEEAQLFLVEDLKRNGSVDGFYGHLLGHTATEAFVTDRLVPLLSTQNSVLQQNLVRVLEHAGSRHGRRYVIH